MLRNKMKCCIAALLVTVIDFADAELSAPCYGYGGIFGEPSNYLEDDMDKVKDLQVGKVQADGSKTYVAYYEYLFEGFSMFKLGYRKTNDVEFRDSSV